MADYYMGVDLGQQHDYTAIVVLSPDQAYRDARATHESLSTTLEHTFRSNPLWDEHDREEYEEKLFENVSEIPEPTFEVRLLERMALRTLYTEVARYIRRLLDAPPLKGATKLAVDTTGVGAGISDQLTEAGLSFEQVVITGFDRETYDRETSRHKVPKRDLIAQAAVLLQNGQLKIAATLPEAATLVDELLNFRLKITDTGHDTYGAWREGQHDDLVLALCMAVWAARQPYEPVGSGWAVGADGPDFGPEPSNSFLEQPWGSL